MKNKKLEERLEWLEKQSNKIMAPYLENVSLAQQRRDNNVNRERLQEKTMMKKQTKTATKKPTKKQLKNIKISKVQEIVNLAIRERDGDCVVRDGKHQCKGVLTASHFFSVGGNSTFRFYPPNIHCQCLGHHGIHERRQEPFFYEKFMKDNFLSEYNYMKKNWGITIRYTLVDRWEIVKLAKAGDLEGLRGYIREMIYKNGGTKIGEKEK